MYGAMKVFYSYGYPFTVPVPVPGRVRVRVRIISCHTITCCLST